MNAPQAPSNKHPANANKRLQPPENSRETSHETMRGVGIRLIERMNTLVKLTYQTNNMTQCHIKEQIG